MFIFFNFKKNLYRKNRYLNILKLVEKYYLYNSKPKMITESFEVCNIFILHVSKNNKPFYYHCFEYILIYYKYQKFKIIKGK